MYGIVDAVQHYIRLFRYDAWANQEVLAGLRASAAPAERPLKFMSHILAAERVWLERLQGQKQSVPVWPQHTADECARQAAELLSLWEKYLAANTEAGLAATVKYKNSSGETWESRPDDILMHVIMHSAYHRGQIAADVRSAGFTPAYTDFIHSIRRRLVE